LLSENAINTPMRRVRSGCCACATIGRAAAMPPSSVTKPEYLPNARMSASTTCGHSAAARVGQQSADNCCKSPKLPGANFPAVKNPTDDRRSMWPQSVTEVASEFIFRRRGRPRLHTKIACTAKRNSYYECKRLFNSIGGRNSV
jgi:hypothetical protein